MDCELMEGLLLEHVLGACEDADRDRVDAHLIACPTCLRCYLDLKRHVEGAERVRPRAEVRDRLRRDVAAAFQPTIARKVRRAFARPIPLYQGFFAAVVAVAIAIAIPVAARGPSMRERSERRVDTSRQVPDSLRIY